MRLNNQIKLGMDGWKRGRVEEWKSGKVEKWKSGRMEEWKSGRVEEWKSGRGEGLSSILSESRRTRRTRKGFLVDCMSWIKVT